MAKKGTEKITAQELEERVRLAELRAREAEAEVRFLEATARRVALKADKRAVVKLNKGKKLEKKTRKESNQKATVAGE